MPIRGAVFGITTPLIVDDAVPAGKDFLGFFIQQMGNFMDLVLVAALVAPHADAPARSCYFQLALAFITFHGSVPLS